MEHLQNKRYQMFILLDVKMILVQKRLINEFLWHKNFHGSQTHFALKL